VALEKDTAVPLPSLPSLSFGERPLENEKECMMTDQFETTTEYDVFEDDLFADHDESNHQTIGRWGLVLLHIIKGAFVLYSGAHNVQAALTATGSNVFALVAQIVGVLVLEATITALYMAGMAGKITGKLQGVVAALFWLTGMALASMGIVADSRLRRHLPKNGYWFAPLSSKPRDIMSSVHVVGKYRARRARADLKNWLSSVGLPYHSPHKFRHGFAVYALKLAQDMADFKAISMNLMHANMSITDGIYAILSEQDISERIASLGSKQTSQGDVAKLLRQLASQIEGRQ
jgi:hypothetical protein